MSTSLIHGVPANETDSGRRELTPPERDDLWRAIQQDYALQRMTRNERVDAAELGVFTVSHTIWRIELPNGRSYSGRLPEAHTPDSPRPSHADLQRQIVTMLGRRPDIWSDLTGCEGTDPSADRTFGLGYTGPNSGLTRFYVLSHYSDGDLDLEDATDDGPFLKVVQLSECAELGTLYQQIVEVTDA